jgi:hypothetical protein
LRQDPHLQATTLLEELEGLGFGGGYSSLTRAIRVRGLRPHCEPCHQGKSRDVAVIDHEPGAETQWDWVHLPDPPQHWGWRREAYLLVGSLPYSGRWRGWLSASQDQPHLIEGLHQIAERLGGLTLGWRFDRMSTVFDHQSQDISASFAQVAKYYGVSAVVCPPRRGQRKGSVEKSNDMAAQRWWRTVPDDLTPQQAQVSLDAWCRRTGDLRVRWAGGIKQNVATFAQAEPLSALPAPFPAVLVVARTVSPQALVSFDGNFYSVPPGHRGQDVTVSRVLGAEIADITSAAGNTLARHRLAPKGAHAIAARSWPVCRVPTLDGGRTGTPLPVGCASADLHRPGGPFRLRGTGRVAALAASIRWARVLRRPGPRGQASAGRAARTRRAGRPPCHSARQTPFAGSSRAPRLWKRAAGERTLPHPIALDLAPSTLSPGRWLMPLLVEWHLGQ